MDWYKVKVEFNDFTHKDEIQGTDKNDALKNAYYNWENKDLKSIELDED